MENIVQAVYRSTEILLNRQHFHDCYQIIFILKGNVDFCINGTTVPARAGSAVILSRYEDHSFRIRSQEYDRFILQLDPGIFSQSSPVYSLLTDRPDGFCHIVDVSADLQEITAIFRQLLREHGSLNRLAREMERLLVEQLLITLYRCTNLMLHEPDNGVVADIKRRLETSFWEQYTLDGLARSYGISVSSLSHRFRAVTGTSVIDYLLSCRMAHAKRMLVETSDSIGTIVEACGFSDSSNFSRAFRQQNGMTPSAFRKVHTG